MSVVNDDSLEMNDADEMLAETDDLNETINGNNSTYIELEKSYNGSFNGGNGIEINRPDVVIDGKGNTIDCTGENSRIFNVQVDGITFKNIIFVGGCSDCGGAIYTNKDLTVINCTFRDNQATGTDNNNQGGGAIFAYDVKMSIYNCTFINNHAVSHGGAVAAMEEHSDDCEIFNCTFIDNVANWYGGAFYSKADKRMGNIINSTFINNRAKYGDAVYSRADKGNIDRCVFINNTANGMICAEYAILTVNNSIIVNNYGDNLVQASTLVMGNNWWGTTVDNLEAPVVSGDTVENYYVLDMTADDDSADISLNNLYYNNGAISSPNNKYALPSINFTVKGSNVEVPDFVVLGANGVATVEHAPTSAYEITICYNGVELTRDVKPSFKWLKNKINSEVSEISLEQDCIYDSTKDYVLAHGIEFAKDMTIDGNGYLIDAMKLSNIIYFDDDTNSYNLTLKNIVFANATGTNGAAVYFKGNKIEIINCTFISNNADCEGDAVYVANALSKDNRITESVFVKNTGNNSVTYLNLDSNAKLKLNNSIFVSNDDAYDVNGTSNVILEYNWLGSTDENKDNLSKIKNVNVSNWLFLKIDAVAAMNGNATISLNNVYDGSEVSTYGEYNLKPFTFTLGGSNCTVSVPEITLGDSGHANYQFRMDRARATLTVSYDNVTTSNEIQYSVVDDGSFRALNEIIFFSDDGAVIEFTHDYLYCDSDTIEDGIVIPRKITINGNGHTIDAKGKTRIFLVPEGVSDVTVNNVSFINAKHSYGSVIVISQNSNYFNFSNCNFTDNVATDYGGVMDCVGDYCSIENCNFVNNRAVSKAGVIRYYHSNEAYIKNSNFINNRVADGSAGGGVIYVDDGAVNIDKSTFINNVANDKPGSVLHTVKTNPITITNSLFLNNPGTHVIYGFNVNLIDSWFGNNETDYDNLSNTVHGASGTWLFLNASVDSNSIPESWPADISFRLYSYNSTSGNVSEYGGNLFDNLEFTITSTNGRTDKSVVNLKEAFAYTPSVPGNGSVTAAVENVFCTMQFDVHAREDSNLSVESQNISYGSNVIMVLNYNNSANGKVNITLKGKNNNYTFLEMDLNNTIELEEIIRPDEYNLTVAYSGDAVFSNTTVTIKLTVDKLESEISAVPYDINVTDVDGMMFTVVLPENATGNLTFKINNDSSLIDVVKEGRKANGKLIVDLRNNARPVGQYNLTAIYSGDDIYKNSSAGVVSNILIIETQISATNKTIDLLVGGESKINCTLNPYDAIGKITFSSNDSNVVYVNPSTGDIEARGEGSAIIAINFSGCENYTASSDTVTVSVSKVPTEIVIVNATFYLKATEKIPVGVSITSDASIDDLRYTISNSNVKIENGEIIALREGNAVITVSYDGDYKYAAASNKTIDVNVALNDASVSVDNSTLDLFVDNSTQISPNTNPGGLNVTYKSSNESVVTVSNGFITAVGEGSAVITISVGGDGVYALNSTTVQIRVSKVPTAIAPSVPSKLFVGNESKVSYTLTPGGAVGNVTYASSNSSVVDVDSNSGKIFARGEGSAIITVYFAGNYKYAESNGTVGVSVSKMPTEIIVANEIIDLRVNDVVDSGASLSPSDEGNLVFNSSNNSVVTVDNGHITAHGTGSAIITVSFAGNDKYAEAESKTIDVNVALRDAGVSVDNSTLDLFIGNVTQISPNTNPGGLKVNYSSSDESVVSVDNGRVTAVGEGSAVITIAIVGEGIYVENSTTVDVSVSKIPTQIILTNENIALKVNDQISIGASLLPGDVPYNLTYTSNNEKIVKVENNTIIALGEGNAIVVVSFAGDDKYAAAKSRNISVGVSLNDAKINVDKSYLALFVGGTGTISATTTPEGLNVTFKSSNESVATVDNGCVTAVGAGNAIITLSVGGDGVYALNSTTVQISVNKVPSEIIIINETLDLKVNGIVDPVAWLNVSSNVNLTFGSSNESVVIVDNGCAVAVGEGRAVITVSFAGDDKYLAAEDKTISVIVRDVLTDASVSVNVSSLDLLIGENTTIHPVTTPAGLNVTYKSSDGSVAIVNEGLVTAVGEGSAIITVRIVGEGIYADNSTSVEVNVCKVPTEIVISNETISLRVNEESATGATLTPAGIDYNLTYTSSDENIIKIENDKIIAVGEGNATVTVSFAGDKKHAKAANKTINVVVSLNDASISVDDSALNLLVGDNSTVHAITNPVGLNVTYKSSDESVVIVDNGLVSAVGAGNAVITVTIVGEGVYVGNSTYVEVTVSKTPTKIVITNETLDLKVKEVVGSGAGLNVSGDFDLAFASSNGSVVMVENGLIVAVGEGSAIVTVSFAGDDKYLAAENKTIGVTVSGVLSDASVSVNVSSLDLLIGENATIYAVTNPAGLNVTYKSSDESVVTVDEGLVAAVGAGSAVVTVTIVGDGKYVENSTVVKVSVGKIPTRITADDTLELFVGNESKINYNLNPTYSIGNVTFTSSNSSVVYVGSAGDIVACGEGSAIITIAFSGSENYTASNATVAVEVNKVKTPVNNNTFPMYKATNTKVPIYSINLPSDAEGNLTVIINGKKYISPVVNGTASVEVPDLSAGNYSVAIIYSGDEKYAPIVKNFNTTVIGDSKVVMKQSSVLYTAKYSVTVYGKDAKIAKYVKVIFYINCKKVKTTKTNSKGLAAFNMYYKCLPNKKYTIRAIALGKSASKRVVVKQILSIKKVAVKKSARKLVLTATLKKVNGKYLRGKKITFKFNGKKYIAKTNKKGVAKVTIKKSALNKLKVGKKITYKATYLKTTVKKTVNVRR